MKTKIDWARFIQLQPSFLYDEIFIENEYRVIESEIKDKTVFDVGANIGMFSCLCLEMGAKSIIAVEAQPSIFKWGLEFNMRLYPQVTPLNFAVLDEDNKEVYITNNFIASHLDLSGQPVKTISLKTLFDKSNDENFILKMDIEGAEYKTILSTDKDTLRRCQFIHIEIHPNPCSFGSIREKIENSGFKLVYSSPAAGDCYIDKWIRM